MPSYNVINYSLRPNKSIQRNLIFQGYKAIQEHLDLRDIVFVGFGSVWFSDFIIAHKQLQINKMISIEDEEVGYRRAEFNKPFKCINVYNDISTNVLTQMVADEALTSKPWFVWLDYDGGLDETVVEDLRIVLENAPPNTALAVTFNADSRSNVKYGKPKDRPERLKTLLGDVVPDELTRDDCDGDRFVQTVAKLTSDFMKSTALGTSRPGGYEPAFKIHYRDGADMITLGGFLPTIGARPTVRQIVRGSQWPCMPTISVETPPLTMKEFAILQAQMPRTKKMTRNLIRRLGFDLEEEQIKAYETYYKYYPTFAQISV